MSVARTNSFIDVQAEAQAILDAAVDAIVSIDERGVVRSMNAAAERMFGYRPDEVVGENVRMLMPEETASEHDRWLQTYEETGERKTIGSAREVIARRKDGSRFPVLLSVGERKMGDQRVLTCSESRQH